MKLRQTGGYDDGYRSCTCFWGTAPGSLLLELRAHLPVDPQGLLALDLGCGEGKNAAYLAHLGIRVVAVDVSKVAILHGITAWAEQSLISWLIADASSVRIPEKRYDVVIAYGLLHCLRDEVGVSATLATMKRAVKPNGFIVMCALNARLPIPAEAHPLFQPTLVSHEKLLEAFRGWVVIHASDRDLWEQHPNNSVVHVHAVTRILARRPSEW